MNGFIFWDSATEKFYDNINTFYDDNINCKCVLVDGKVLVHHYYNEYEECLFNPYKEDNIIIALKDIGLKDINDKKIYADSSIVEFKHSQLWNTYFGIFFYNNIKLCYQIKIIDNSNRNGEIIPYDIYCFNLEIIDTIQENKLGLIK